MGKRGFTLVELMIVIVIVGVLASITFSNYGQAQKRINYGNNVNKVIESIRNMRALALNSEMNAPVDIACGADAYPLAYGVKIVNADSVSRKPAMVYTYTDFCNPLNDFDEMELDPASTDGIMVYEKFELSKEISFDFTNINVYPAGVNYILIKFIPPYADFNINISDANLELPMVSSDVSFEGDNQVIFLNKVSGIPQIKENE